MREKSSVISITIIEDDTELLDLWGDVFQNQRGILLFSSYTNCETALQHLQEDEPDVVLMDIQLDGPMSGIDGVREIKHRLPETDVIMVTVNEDEDAVFDALRAGASGYLLKHVSPDELLHAIQDVHNGGAPMSMSIGSKVVDYFKREDALNTLTDREHQVLKLLCHGNSQKQIAGVLGISLDTVKFHCKHIYQKMGVKNAAEAAYVAGQRKP